MKTFLAARIVLQLVLIWISWTKVYNKCIDDPNYKTGSEKHLTFELVIVPLLLFIPKTDCSMIK